MGKIGRGRARQGQVELARKEEFAIRRNHGLEQRAPAGSLDLLSSPMSETLSHDRSAPCKKPKLRVKGVLVAREPVFAFASLLSSVQPTFITPSKVAVCRQMSAAFQSAARKLASWLFLRVECDCTVADNLPGSEPLGIRDFENSEGARRHKAGGFSETILYRKRLSFWLATYLNVAMRLCASSTSLGANSSSMLIFILYTCSALHFINQMSLLLNYEPSGRTTNSKRDRVLTLYVTPCA